ncbi:MAG: PTS sugar transporter subunit IIA [Kiritimatiellae bacterium]|nr:PTS sugar transporter subunit IIA [Kiritimatiellia bacterium]
MNFKKALLKDSILLDLKSDTKNGVLEEMIDLFIAAGKIQDRKGVLKAILEREKKMSTGMQNGIAIPHAKTDQIENLIAALAIKKEGIDFGALNKQPSKIFIMTLSPTKRAGPHIQFLAEVSRLLNEPDIRDRVLNATSKDEIIEFLGHGGG